MLLLDLHVISSFPFGIIRTSFTRSMCISSDRLFISFLFHKICSSFLDSLFLDFYTYATKYAVLSLTPTNCMQSNPIARWHVSQGSINGIAFSTDGTYLATVGRDGMTLYLLLHLMFSCCFILCWVVNVIDLSLLLMQVTCEFLTI
jgi:WD40 repeat protein